LAELTGRSCLGKLPLGYKVNGSHGVWRQRMISLNLFSKDSQRWFVLLVKSVKSDARNLRNTGEDK
jgi:hypothetical protein